MPVIPTGDWTLAPMFDRQPGCAGLRASPAFRITVSIPYSRGYHGLFREAYGEVFDCLAPLLKDRCDRIRICTKPSGKYRRNLKIQPQDWAPFTQLLAAHDDIATGMFVSFRFIDRSDESDFGRGPTQFNYYCGVTPFIDLCIPVADFTAGRLDLQRLLGAIQKLPYLSFTGGYGLSMSESACNGEFPESHPVAVTFPALDVIRPDVPGWWRHDPIEEVGIRGIAWLTGIGEPYRSRLGGAAGLRALLPPEIGILDGPHGVVLQLGPRPITGEAGVDDGDLHLYHAVGQVLRQVWMPTAQNRSAQAFEWKWKDLSLSIPYHQRFYIGSVAQID